MTSEFWFDNWLVEGVEANADIEDLEMESLPRSRRVIPEVVPFLVPEAHDQQIVVIGEQQVGLGSIAVSIIVQGFVEIDNDSIRQIQISILILIRGAFARLTRCRSSQKRLPLAPCLTFPPPPPPARLLMIQFRFL